MHGDQAVFHFLIGGQRGLAIARDGFIIGGARLGNFTADRPPTSSSWNWPPGPTDQKWLGAPSSWPTRRFQSRPLRPAAKTPGTRPRARPRYRHSAAATSRSAPATSGRRSSNAEGSANFHRRRLGGQRRRSQCKDRRRQADEHGNGMLQTPRAPSGSPASCARAFCRKVSAWSRSVAAATPVS